VATIFTELHLRPSRPAWTGSERRAPSDRPPVDVPERLGDPIPVGGSMLGAYGLPAPGGTYGSPIPGSYGPPAPDGTYPNPIPPGSNGAPAPSVGASTGWEPAPGAPGPAGSNGGQSHGPGAAHPSAAHPTSPHATPPAGDPQAGEGAPPTGHTPGDPADPTGEVRPPGSGQ